MEYKDLDVWKESRKLVQMIYNLSKSFPKEEAFGLSHQIPRSSISVPSNIAEGCGRRTSANTLQFLYIARGSLYELETQLILASDQGYLGSEVYEKTLEQIVSCKKLLNGFINYFATK